jgi:ATP-binding cassette subfamily B multidrug efflux pump
MHRREWGMAGVCTLLILGQIYFDLALPDYMSDLTVLIESPGSSMSDILRTGGEMLGCTLASAVLCVVCGYLTAKVSAGFSYTLRQEVFYKIADFGQQEMMAFSVPSLITRTTNDITQVQMLLAMGLQILIKSPIMAVWAVIKIINKSWTLSAITAGFILALLAMMLIILSLVIPRFRKVQKLVDHINLLARENLTGINVVHAYNAEDYQNAKFLKSNEELMRTQLFNQRAFAFLVPGVTLAMNALSLVIYWVGAAIINNVPAADTAVRLATFGNIVVFSTYATYVIMSIMMMAMIIMSIMMMAMIIMLMPAAQVSAQRIGEVLDTRVHLKQGNCTDSPEKGTVEFKDVSFHYPTSGKDVLEHISFTVRKGETVAFIGATGSGKTTLVSLAARFYDATAGQVLIDGVDVKDYTFDALYDRIGYVTQKAILFSGDIRSNVFFGESRGGSSDGELQDALDLAQASEFVEKLPEGIHAPIAQGGSNVSGGQKQRLSIARALARKPEILVFDDSFSALDYRTDATLRAGLARELKDTTKLIVAQRIGTIRDADKIIVLDEGKIAGMGTHEELMQTCPVYQEIARSQLSSEELSA